MPQRSLDESLNFLGVLVSEIRQILDEFLQVFDGSIADLRGRCD